MKTVTIMPSTHKGQAVFAFPDVCKVPTPTGPLPISYPNIAMTSDGAKAASKTKIATTSVVVKGQDLSKSSGDAAGLRSHLAMLHIKILSMSPVSSTDWHATLDDYVLTTAKLYVTLADRR